MPQVNTTSTHTIVLTDDGRRRLEERLLQATEALRQIVEGFGDDGDPTAEHQRALDHVEELRAVLGRARRPTDVPDDPRIVEVGDEVEIEHEDGETERCIVVDPVEAAFSDDRVSVASPLGQALVGRSVGDRVTVSAPVGQFRCLIRARRRAT